MKSPPCYSRLVRREGHGTAVQQALQEQEAQEEDAGRAGRQVNQDTGGAGRGR